MNNLLDIIMRVRAKRDFIVAGSIIAIHKGEVCIVVDSNSNVLWVRPRRGSLFGACSWQDWEKVEENNS